MKGGVEIPKSLISSPNIHKLSVDRTPPDVHFVINFWLWQITLLTFICVERVGTFATQNISGFNLKDILPRRVEEYPGFCGTLRLSDWVLLGKRIHPGYNETISSSFSVWHFAVYKMYFKTRSHGSNVLVILLFNKLKETSKFWDNQL